MGKVVLSAPDTGEKIELFVLEKTCINNVNYLLTTETEEEESTAYILKEVQTDEAESVLEFVEDDIEFDAISKVFEELLEDVGIEK